jgi:hypothetical protein
LTKEVDRIPRLKQFPEIINAGRNDQQAAEAIGYCIKDKGLLYEKEIGQ